MVKTLIPLFKRANTAMLAILLLATSSQLNASKRPKMEQIYHFPDQTWGEISKDGETRIYFGCDDGNCYSFDLQNKSVCWKYTTKGRVRSKPLIIGTKIFVNSDDGYLYCLLMETGELIWKTQIDTKLERRLPALEGPYDYDYLVSSPVSHTGTIFVGTVSGELVSINAENGEINWTFKSEGRIRSTPVATSDTVFFGSWDHHIYSLDQHTGQLKWKYQTEGILNSSPVLDENNLYIGSRDTNLYAINLRTGQLAWKHRYEDGSWADSSGIIWENNLYFGSSDALKVSKFNCSSGEEIWTFKTGGWTWCKPLIEKGIIYISGISAHPYYFEGVTLQNGLFAVDLTANKLVWKIPAPQIDGYVTGGFFTQPILNSKNFYALSIDGTLFRIEKQ